MFERFDSDRVGYLDAPRFKSALPTILRAPKGVEVPASRANFYWKEVDTSRTGKISFEQFFWWYQRGGFDDAAPKTPMSARHGRLGASAQSHTFTSVVSAR